MEELKAKWTFEQGGFAKAMIVPTPMGAGWGRFRIRKLKHVKRSDTQQLRGFAQAPHLWKPHFRDSRNSAVSAVQYESGFRESNMPYQHCRGSDSH